jgi:K(+)-stimulated pyrophosphate-energized sodium pump
MKDLFKVRFKNMVFSMFVGLVTAMFLPPSLALASEASLVLPDLKSDTGPKFFGSLSGFDVLIWGLLVCVIGALFGVVMFQRLKKYPTHEALREISELIWATCKAYLLTQGRFLIILWALVAAIIVIYFAFLQHMDALQVVVIVLFSIIGILGSYGVAWFGMRINQFATSRVAFAVLRGWPFPTYEIPTQSGMSIGLLLISVELVIMLFILLFVPGNWAGPCFIGFAIGESLGAAALRIAGGVFTKIADIGADLIGKVVFKIKEDDPRNPGVIADCTGDNAGDSVGPTADGFETYGVTGVALITFIMLAVPQKDIQIQLLVWIFAMRIMMIVTSLVSYFANHAWAVARYKNAKKMDFEVPLTTLVWLTSVISILVTYLSSYLLIPELGGGSLWWKLATIISCGTLAGAIIPELVKIFTSVNSGHVREILASAKQGGASLDILSGFVAGNFSAYWMGIAIAALMAIAFAVSTQGLSEIMAAPAVFAFGLVAFGFLGMGPVTIAVDCYGPVTDNAQSVYELSLIETLPNIKEEIKQKWGFEPDFENAKGYLEEGDGAGNTFKASAKPVLIGTAVVGATTLIFSTLLLLGKRAAGIETALNLTVPDLEQALHRVAENFSILHAPFLLGLMLGGAVIYWFTGAANQAVVTGAYKAAGFIKDHIRLEEGATKATVEESQKVVEICTVYGQKGMFNIFIGVFFSALAFAFIDEYLFLGYLISIAFFGLFQAIFMANAGAAWDNAKKLLETQLKGKGTDLHAALVVGDTVGDPFKDTASVSLNPVIKFTTLFGLLAVELAIEITNAPLRKGLGILFLLISFYAVYRTFYNMRIGEEKM